MFGQFDKLNTDCRKSALLFLHKWEAWRRRIGHDAKVAVYGGGQHTENLFDAVGDRLGEMNIIAILDKDPPVKAIKNIPLHNSDTFDYESIDHIIITYNTESIYWTGNLRKEFFQ